MVKRGCKRKRENRQRHVGKPRAERERSRLGMARSREAGQSERESEMIAR